MYYGDQAALLLNKHRRMLKREHAHLLELAKKPRTASKENEELSRQVAKVRSLRDQSLADSIEFGRTVRRRLVELNLVAGFKGLDASGKVSALCQEVDKTLKDLEPRIKKTPQPANPGH